MYRKIEWTDFMDSRIVAAANREISFTKAAAEIGVSKNSALNRVRTLNRQVAVSSWKDEDVALVRREWAAGTLARDIGALIGKSKNAIIGKAHRLGLEQRISGPTGPRKAGGAKTEKAATTKREPKQAMIINKKAVPPKFYAAATPITTKAPISIMELTADTCRAPVGFGSNGLVVYCGDMTFPGKAWCPGHCAMYFQPPRERRYR